MDYDVCESASVNVLDQERALEIARSEVFDLRVQLDIATREVEPLREAAYREQALADELEDVKGMAQEQAEQIERQAAMLEILQAELEVMQKREYDTGMLWKSYLKTRQAEACRIICVLYDRDRERILISGFNLWRGVVIDRASFRLGMARRACFAGCAVPTPVIKQRPIRREVGTQTDRAIHDIIAENETLSNKLNKIENIGTLVNRTNTAHSSKADRARTVQPPRALSCSDQKEEEECLREKQIATTPGSASPQTTQQDQTLNAASPGQVSRRAILPAGLDTKNVASIQSIQQAVKTMLGSRVRSRRS